MFKSIWTDQIKQNEFTLYVWKAIQNLNKLPKNEVSHCRYHVTKCSLNIIGTKRTEVKKDKTFISIYMNINECDIIFLFICIK